MWTIYKSTALNIYNSLTPMRQWKVTERKTRCVWANKRVRLVSFCVLFFLILFDSCLHECLLENEQRATTTNYNVVETTCFTFDWIFFVYSLFSLFSLSYSFSLHFISVLWFFGSEKLLTVVRMPLDGGEMILLFLFFLVFEKEINKLCAFISALALANVNKWTVEVKLMRHALYFCSHYILLTVFIFSLSKVLPEVAFYCSCCVYAAASWSIKQK